MKTLGWIIIGIIALLLMGSGYFAFRADTKAYPENHTMYFELVFENDTVIHKPLWKNY